MCICGKEFNNPQKFNGHKQGCNEHIINKYGDIKLYYEIKNRSKNQGDRTRSQKQQLLKEQEVLDWISKQHACEKCGKVMTEKFGSGRFCCRACANSRVHSQETKLKIKQTLTINFSNTERAQENDVVAAMHVVEYLKNPARCLICGSIIPYEKRKNKTCSKGCLDKLHSLEMKEKYKKGIYHTNVRYRYKYGTYCGVHCDSSWELAFVLYLKDHNIAFTRNSNDFFEYTYQEELHSFFPDFIIDNVYYEIKNYVSELTEAKKRCFPADKQLKILYYNDMKVYLDYAKQTYGKDFFRLYDRNYPSWMDNYDR